MAKILYFEGAGCEKSKVGDVENCRIRTAFHNDDGKGIYLEMHGNEYANFGGSFAGISQCKIVHCNPICANGYRKHEKIDVKEDSLSMYTLKGILRIVNSLGCSFDEIIVLPWFAGFNVHARPEPGYNYGDEFSPNKSLIKQRKEVYNYFNACFSNFSCWIDRYNPALLHVREHSDSNTVYFETPKLKCFLIDVTDNEWETKLHDVS